MNETAEIVVVGAGVMGLATACALARDGHEVIVLEQFRVGHKRGSSHGGARIFRMSYDDPEYVAMAKQALPLWRDLEAETGVQLLTTMGCLDLGLDARARAERFSEQGLEFERLRARDVEARWPISLGRYDEALFQPDAGFVRADRAQHAFSRSAADNGADLREDMKVTALSVDDGSVTVATDEGPLTAGVAVVTAGAWASSLLEPLGIRLPLLPTRETVSYFELDGDQLVPPVIDWADPPSAAGEAPMQSYSLPSGNGHLKAGTHRSGPVADPNDEGAPEDEIARSTADWVARHHPTAQPQPAYSETCLYTNTPDEKFVLERRGRVVVGSPCSGHGFKFAPLIGEKLAALAREASRQP
jgi:sarcosine oxidase